MDRRILAIVLALVAVAVAVGIGTQLYQAGVARGLAESGQITPRPEGVPPYGYYGPYGYRPFGFGFGFFGFLFPLLFFFLIFALFKGLFWRPWGWYRRRRLLRRTVNQATIRSINRSYALGTPLYLLSMILALISAPASRGMNLLLAVFYAFPSRLLPAPFR